jgi:hypothetical protein
MLTAAAATRLDTPGSSSDSDVFEKDNIITHHPEDDLYLVNNPYWDRRTNDAKLVEKEIRSKRKSCCVFGVTLTVLVALFFTQVYFYDSIKNIPPEKCLKELTNLNQLSMVILASMAIMYIRFLYTEARVLYIYNKTLAKDHAIWNRRYADKHGSGNYYKHMIHSVKERVVKTRLLDYTDQQPLLVETPPREDERTEAESSYQDIDLSDTPPTHRRISSDPVLTKHVDIVITRSADYRTLKDAARLGRRIGGDLRFNDLIRSSDVKTWGADGETADEIDLRNTLTDHKRCDHLRRRKGRCPPIKTAVPCMSGKDDRKKSVGAILNSKLVKYKKWALLLPTLPVITTFIWIVWAANIASTMGSDPTRQVMYVDARCTSSYIFNWCIIAFVTLYGVVLIIGVMLAGSKKLYRSH